MLVDTGYYLPCFGFISLTAMNNKPVLAIIFKDKIIKGHLVLIIQFLYDGTQ